MRTAKFKVYLAGPISGLTYDDAQEWREDASHLLGPYIAAYSPLRAKSFLRSEGKLEGSYSNPLASQRGIMTRDHFDCQTSDAILCYLLGVTKPSLGTVMEMAWAYAYKKPLVVVMEPGDCVFVPPINPHDGHPMILEAIDYRVTTLEEGCDVIRSILLNV